RKSARLARPVAGVDPRPGGVFRRLRVPLAALCVGVGVTLIGATLLAVGSRRRDDTREAPPALATGSDRAALEREASALLERWAPSFSQEVSTHHPERDRPMRVDF